VTSDECDVLLRKARADLALLVGMDAHGIATDEQYGFHCQQAVEKALKSVLGRRGIDFPWTHDLTRLLNLVDSAGIAVPADLRGADLYTAFAVRFRYADLDDAADPSCAFDRAAARAIATQAVEWAAQPHKEA
jgi:HEPN domain-containing protein